MKRFWKIHRYNNSFNSTFLSLGYDLGYDLSKTIHYKNVNTIYVFCDDSVQNGWWGIREVNEESVLELTSHGYEYACELPIKYIRKKKLEKLFYNPNL